MLAVRRWGPTSSRQCRVSLTVWRVWLRARYLGSSWWRRKHLHEISPPPPFNIRSVSRDPRTSKETSQATRMCGRGGTPRQTSLSSRRQTSLPVEPMCIYRPFIAVNDSSCLHWPSVPWLCRRSRVVRLIYKGERRRIIEYQSLSKSIT